MVLVNQHHAEVARLQHTFETTVATAYGQRACRIVIAQLYGTVLSLLILVVGAFVLVEQEASITSCIDVEGDRVGRLLVGILQRRAKGNNGSLGDEDGNALIGCIDDDAAARE